MKSELNERRESRISWLALATRRSTIRWALVASVIVVPALALANEALEAATGNSLWRLALMLLVPLFVAVVSTIGAIPPPWRDRARGGDES